jgi:hypothetical protein
VRRSPRRVPSWPRSPASWHRNSPARTTGGRSARNPPANGNTDRCAQRC